MLFVIIEKPKEKKTKENIYIQFHSMEDCLKINP